MRSKLFLFGALTLLTLQACQPKEESSAAREEVEAPAEQETPEKMIETLVGEWRLATEGASTTQGQPQSGGRTLTFTNEARYILREGNQKADSGAYRMNEQLQNLYLESETDQEPREYEVQLSQDSLIMSPKTGEGSREVYVRSN